MESARTIVALSTPSGVSAVAVVRVSGPQASEVLRHLSGKSLLSGTIRDREMMHLKVRDPRSGELLDDLMACIFLGPRSYTGEDVLELFPHGNPILVRHLVDAIRTLPGVRLAEPGEFTRRAFENGKIDLVQAEAVGQLLQATVQSGIQNAERLLSGKLSRQIAELTEGVRHLSALLELEVDFAEEEADADQSAWVGQLEVIRKQLQTLVQGFRSSGAENRTPSVVFYGAPNAGKSSFVNALLQDDRLLVSPRAGTTRDVVEVLLLLDRGEVRLLDTAGLSSSPVDELDERSQQKSLERIERADLAILLVESGHEDQLPLAEHHWVIRTKADLIEIHDQKAGEWVSALSGFGIAEFLQRLTESLFPEEIVQEDFWIASERQQFCLQEALNGIKRALDLLHSGRSAPEELAFELRGVRDSLVSITGHISSESILNKIFGSFCIGK